MGRAGPALLVIPNQNVGTGLDLSWLNAANGLVLSRNQITSNCKKNIRVKPYNDKMIKKRKQFDQRKNHS